MEFILNKREMRPYLDDSGRDMLKLLWNALLLPPPLYEARRQQRPLPAAAATAHTRLWPDIREKKVENALKSQVILHLQGKFNVQAVDFVYMFI